jgi:hypothetical protein
VRKAGGLVISRMFCYFEYMQQSGSTSLGNIFCNCLLCFETDSSAENFDSDEVKALEVRLPDGHYDVY